MSDRVVQTYHDTDTETRDIMHPYQSACMSQWMRHRSSNLPTLEHDHIALDDASKGEDLDYKQVLALAPIAEHRKAPTLPVDKIPSYTFECMNARGYTGDLVVQNTDVLEPVQATRGIAPNVRSELLHPFGGTPVQSVVPREKETQPSSSYVQSKEYFAQASCAHIDCDYSGQSKFSQTTHNMLITKKFGVNICEEDQMIRKSTVCSESKGNAWPGHLGLLPDFDYHVEHRVVLSSKDNPGKECVGDEVGSLGINNESSVDNDIMDTKAFQTRNNFLGVDSSPLAKDVMVGQIPAKYQVVSPSREVESRKREFKLPDLNEMPPCSDSESAMENMDFSTSRTESLDMECLHSQVVNVEKLTYNPLPNTPQGLDPSSTWAKRIKNSRSEYASCTENISTPLKKNMDNSRTTTEPTSHLGEKQMELGKNMMLSRSREPSSMVKHPDPALSHPWIRRWCPNVAGAPTIKPSGDPQRSNAALDVLERRQLPSIAAMALMGKAMSGFQKCEFINKGSFVVWSD